MYFNALALLTLTGAVLGHLNLEDPLGLGHDDQEANYPLGCCTTEGTGLGPNKEATAEGVPPGPRGCRGYLHLLDSTPSRTTWKGGEKVTFKLQSNHPNGLSSTHYGGSCQTGFSFDRLVTTKVATSFPGSCPHRKDGSDQTFEIEIPDDIPSGDALFIWTFNNREGEFFESCAPVTIEGSGPADNSTITTPEEGNTTKAPSSSATAPTRTPGATSSSTKTKPEQSIQTPPVEEESDETEPVEEVECRGRHCERKTRKKRAVAWAQRPAMLFNDFPGADCFSQAFIDEQHDTELEYPNPGPQVVKGDGEYKLALPSGAACGV
jgi:hypothetical protein